LKLSELIAEVNKDLDDTLSNADIIGWLNRCLDDLSPVANYPKSSTISTVKDQKEYALPSDLINTVLLIDEDKKLEYPQVELRNYAYTGYKRWGANVTLQPTPSEVRTLSLYYHATLPKLVNPDDVPAIRSDFHDLLVLYAVAKAKYQDEEESMQLNAMSEYTARKEAFIAATQTKEAYTIQEVYWG
jgi:hypothetical protein